jgi:hypothetical protein
MLHHNNLNTDTARTFTLICAHQPYQRETLQFSDRPRTTHTGKPYQDASFHVDTSWQHPTADPGNTVKRKHDACAHNQPQTNHDPGVD